MRRRLVASYLVIAVFVLVSLEVPLGIVAANRERDSVRSVAERDAAILSAIALRDFHADDHGASKVDLDDLVKRYESGTGAAVVVVDRSGSIVAFHAGTGSRATRDPADLDVGNISGALAGQRSVASGTEGGRPVEIATEPVAAPDGDIVGAVRVSVPSDHAEQRIRRMILLLVAFAIGVLVMVVAVGIIIAGSVTRPLRRLTDAVRGLEQGDLGARTVAGGPPEIRVLGAAFNAMADRLTELIDSQRNFVADASHQLRTPLTALRLRLEAIDVTRVAETRSDIDEAIVEVGRMTRMVEGLLALVRNEGARPARIPIDVAVLLAERAEAWEPLAAEHGVSIVIEAAPASVQALDAPGHAAQVIDNLLDNALGVAPTSSTITLVAEIVGDDDRRQVQVSVTDEGPGMTGEQRATAFERFWQGERTTGSAGLGLAISRQLARASGGDLTLEAGPIGLRAILTLDAAPAVGPTGRLQDS